MNAAAWALILLGGYLAVGAVVAVPFVIWGAGKIDPALKASPRTVRLLIYPGSVAVWPLMLKRWLAAIRGPGSAAASSDPQIRQRQIHSMIWPLVGPLLLVLIGLVLWARPAQPVQETVGALAPSGRAGP